MLDPTKFALFLAAAWALIVVPGPDILYVVARGLAGGRQAGIISGLGIGFGEVVHTVLAALGLATLLKTSLVAFLLVKYVGAAYLIYLGIRTFLERGELVFRSRLEPARLRSVFWQGVLTNLFNPKAVLFFIAFLPQFVDPKRGNVQVQMLMLGFLYALLDVFFLCVLAYFTGRVSAWLARRPRQVGRIRWVTGGVLVGIGVRLAFTDVD